MPIGFPYAHCLLSFRPVHRLPLAPIQKRPMGEPAVDAGPHQIKTNHTVSTISTTHELPSGLDFRDHTDLEYFYDVNLAKTLRHSRNKTKQTIGLQEHLRVASRTSSSWRKRRPHVLTHLASNNMQQCKINPNNTICNTSQHDLLMKTQSKSDCVSAWNGTNPNVL